MRRREFIALLSATAAAWPHAAWAQQRSMPVIGYLRPVSPDASPHHEAAFHKGLSETGYVEGRNVAIEYRWANNENDRLPELAADLVRRRVNVIVTPGSGLASLAAKAATTTIPIVFGGPDPVRLGLVASFNRPGGNATGFSEMNPEIAPKRLALLHELVPAAMRFGVLFEARSPSTPFVITDLQAAASTIGGQIEVFMSPGIGDIDAAFASLVQKRVDALLVNPSPLFMGLRAHIATLAARHAVPAIYWDRALAEAGGLMSYGSSIEDQFRQVGIYAGRILKGEKPADMPVLQPTKFEFVVNLKAAKALGLTIPPTLLAITTEVLE